MEEVLPSVKNVKKKLKRRESKEQPSSRTAFLLACKRYERLLIKYMYLECTPPPTNDRGPRTKHPMGEECGACQEISGEHVSKIQNKVCSLE